MIDDIKDFKCEYHHGPFGVEKETDHKADFAPCPFCGSKNIIVKEEFFLLPDPIGAYCMCGNCFSKTALCWDKETAVEVWNKRAYEVNND